MDVPCNSDVAAIDDVAWSIAMVVTTPPLSFEGQTMFCDRWWKQTYMKHKHLSHTNC